MSVPYKHDQAPRPLPALRPGRRLTWLRIRAIALDLNGNDTNGFYYGRDPQGRVLYRADFPDGTWQAFRIGAFKREVILLHLSRLYPKATIEWAPPIELQFGPNIDHAHEQVIEVALPKDEEKAAQAVVWDKAPLPSRGERWKALRDKRIPQTPEAREHSHRLQARLNELVSEHNET